MLLRSRYLPVGYQGKHRTPAPSFRFSTYFCAPNVVASHRAHVCWPGGLSMGSRMVSGRARERLWPRSQPAQRVLPHLGPEAPAAPFLASGPLGASICLALCQYMVLVQSVGLAVIGQLAIAAVYPLLVLLCQLRFTATEREVLAPWSLSPRSSATDDAQDNPI